ncbi:RICIN domain-containing protein [Streptomyces sp. NBC_00433]
MGKWIARVFLATTVAVGLSVSALSPAQASDAFWKFQTVYDGSHEGCLTGGKFSGPTAGTFVGPCVGGSAYQEWVFITNNSDHYNQLDNVGEFGESGAPYLNHFCLTVDGPGQPVYMRSCVDGSNLQAWRYDASAGAFFNRAGVCIQNGSGTSVVGVSGDYACVPWAGSHT